MSLQRMSKAASQPGRFQVEPLARPNSGSTPPTNLMGPLPEYLIDAFQRNVLFLDIRMEHVEEHAEAGMTDILAQLLRVGQRVDEVGLVAIERFDRYSQLVLRQGRAHRLETFDRPRPFIGRAAAARQVPDRRVNGSAQTLGPEFR